MRAPCRVDGTGLTGGALTEAYNAAKTAGKGTWALSREFQSGYHTGVQSEVS